MAYFHLRITPIKRSTGHQATGAAAYRAGEIIRDERTGTRHDHSKRKDVRHAEIFLPSRFDGAPMEWARDRTRLWNTVEAAEKRRNSRVAREFQVALPEEMNPEQRLSLARSFARELADRYGIAVDLAIHDPKPGRESTNFHAHLLATTREVTPTGLGAKTGLELGSVQRAQLGLTTHVEEYGALRERWATLTNEALRAANIDASIDHRSLAAQGIDRKPVLHIPMEFYQLERQGVPKEQAESIRAGYRARVTAFRERSAGATAGNEARPHARGEEIAPANTRQQGLARTERARAASDPSRAMPEPNRAAPELSRATPEPNRAAPELSRAAPEPNRATSEPSRATPHPGRAPAEPPQPERLVPRNAEEIRRQAVQQWLQMRSKEAESTRAHGTAKDATIERGREEGRER